MNKTQICATAARLLESECPSSGIYYAIRTPGGWSVFPYRNDDFPGMPELAHTVGWFTLHPGDVVWIKDGKPHRDGGPAIEQANGNKYWYQHGKLHRERIHVHAI